MTHSLRKPVGIVAFLLALLVSCAPSQSLIKAPEVAVKSLRLVDFSPPVVGSGQATFTVSMDVKNPNPMGLQLRLLSSSVSLDGVVVGTFEIPNLALSANGTSVVNTNIKIPISLNLVQKFSDIWAGKNVVYKMTGNMTMDGGVLGSPTFGPLTLAEGNVQR